MRPSARPSGSGSASEGSHRHRAGRPDDQAGQGRRRARRPVASSPPWLRRPLNKVFPDHWSFLLGEIALYSFIVLLLTGTFLTFFFDASMREVVYDGTYAPLRGVEMSAAYDSALDLSFDVRGGLFMRQMHHWAALLFMAAIVVHMLRIFFTGAFRKPRETNWLIGVVLLVLGSHGLHRLLAARRPALRHRPADRQRDHAVHPGHRHLGALRRLRRRVPRREIIGRFYIVHVLLIPAILLALIALHLLILVKQKHTQCPGAGPDQPQRGRRAAVPDVRGQGGRPSSWSSASSPLLGGLFQINPIWLFGPYNAAQVSAASQPDWYVGFLDGSTRLFPAWEINLPGDYTIPALFWPTVVIAGADVHGAGALPVHRAQLTKDTASHHLLQRPRDVPVRTALGAMALTFYVWLMLSGGNDVIADKFHISLNAMTWVGRIGVLVLPPLAYVITYRICLGLQQHDREVLAHGVETGIIRRLPDGGFVEVHQPLGPVDEHGHGALDYVGAPVPKKMNPSAAPAGPSAASSRPIEKPAQVELEQRAEGRGLAAGESREPRARRRSGAARPTADDRPTAAGRRNRATDVRSSDSSRAPVDSTGALLLSEAVPAFGSAAPSPRRSVVHG